MSKLNESQQSLDFIPFSVPALGQEEKEAVLRVMDSGWLTTAKEALAFEQEFASFVGGAQGEASGGEIKALAVNSATSGLQLAYHACGVGFDWVTDGAGASTADDVGSGFFTSGKNIPHQEKSLPHPIPLCPPPLLPAILEGEWCMPTWKLMATT